MAYTVMQKANWKNTEAVVRGKALVVLAGAVLGKEMPYEMLLPLVAGIILHDLCFLIAS